METEMRKWLMKATVRIWLISLSLLRVHQKKTRMKIVTTQTQSSPSHAKCKMQGMTVVKWTSRTETRRQWTNQTHRTTM